MSYGTRYKCYGCGNEHSTDNVVCYCAPCYSLSIDTGYAHALKRIEQLEGALKEIERRTGKMGGLNHATAAEALSNNQGEKKR